ncbi:arsenical pump-driving ATPase [Aquabacterium sp.]|uniref:arsenical pump-driving ATPase n=1 Tax=Aquabacterium sp. TaxID=1872578 RepID=UPI002E30103A|nr:arsenical pump-driving ATPase [Aquabacterium sp.]HEX5312064.1 arsenical pump-driving ATPase [Aquabacterium sp.]
MHLLPHPTRYVFFTGKGGVGKTSLSTATALALADSGKRVLLVSTDAASNLDEMLEGTPLLNHPTAVAGAPGLWVLNIDPQAAAQAYRARVLAQMAHNSDEERRTVQEQLSGACTTEIASFDEFSSLLANDHPDYDHIIFDTAPTGHTLRLLSLPKAWSGFLAGNDRGASCLGPHSGLKMQETRFNAAMQALANPELTTVVLVARPDPSTLNEAALTAQELHAMGLQHQQLVINAVFHASDRQDRTAMAMESMGQAALSQLPSPLNTLPIQQVPMRPFDTVGLTALRALLSDQPLTPQASGAISTPAPLPARKLRELADELSTQGKGLIMVMGKGGVGKTTIAAALALALVRKGHAVHLSTTDPAAHLASTLQEEVPGLEVSRIDPKAETRHYIDKVMSSKGAKLSPDERALLLEDLQSPCTEEVAVFHAFSRTVAQARSAFVVLDTAPTGHSLLLMDATGAYHRQMTREFEQASTSVHLVTPLMRLQDANYTRVILVTLPEITPVSQAQALQEDLQRASIQPYAWVVNKSIAATGTTDPLLQSRLQGELRQMARIRDGLSERCHVVPWLPDRPVGVSGLDQLL